MLFVQSLPNILSFSNNLFLPPFFPCAFPSGLFPHLFSSLHPLLSFRKPSVLSFPFIFYYLVHSLANSSFHNPLFLSTVISLHSYSPVFVSFAYILLMSLHNSSMLFPLFFILCPSFPPFLPSSLNVLTLPSSALIQLSSYLSTMYLFISSFLHFISFIHSLPTTSFLPPFLPSSLYIPTLPLSLSPFHYPFSLSFPSFLHIISFIHATLLLHSLPFILHPHIFLP